MEDRRTDGRTDGGHFHPFLFFLVLFGSRARRGPITTFSTHSTLVGPGNQLGPGPSFLYTLCVSLLCRFFFLCPHQNTHFLVCGVGVWEEIKQARVGVYIGVLDLPWIGP